MATNPFLVYFEILSSKQNQLYYGFVNAPSRYSTSNIRPAYRSVYLLLMLFGYTDLQTTSEENSNGLLRHETISGCMNVFKHKS